MKVKRSKKLFIGTCVFVAICPFVVIALALANGPTDSKKSCCSGTPSPIREGIQGPQPEQESLRLQRWGEFLSVIAIKEDVCLVAPIVTSNWPPAPFKRAYGTDVLPMMEAIMGARSSVVDGTLTFQNVLDRPEAASKSAQSWIGQWLRSASAGEIAEATSREGLSLASMGAADRLDALGHLGLTQELVEGFVANGDQAKLNVRFVVEVTGTGPTGKGVHYRIDVGPKTTPSEKDLSPRSKSRVPADSPKNRDGELDFGTGKVVTAKVLRDLVQSKLGRGFEMDQRLEGSYLFLAGKFDFEELLSAAKHALGVPLVQEYDQAQALSDKEVSELARERLSALISAFENGTGVKADWALERRTMSASVLADLDPGFKGYLASKNVNPSSLSVTLVPTFVFQASAPGSTSGIGTGPNQPAPTYRHNFGFAFHPG